METKKLWYLKAAFIKGLLDHIQKDRALLKTHPDWEMKWKDTFDEFMIRVPHMEDRLARNGKNKTITHISFVVEMEENANVRVDINDKLNVLKSVFKQRRGSTKNRGAWYMEYLQAHNHSALRNSLIMSMSDGKDETETANCIAVEFNKYLSGDGLDIEWDITLDKMWTNYYIKQFLKDHVGVDSWEDVSSEDKKKCYLYYDPNSTRFILPDWNNIVKLRYDD